MGALGRGQGADAGLALEAGDPHLLHLDLALELARLNAEPGQQLLLLADLGPVLGGARLLLGDPACADVIDYRVICDGGGDDGFNVWLSSQRFISGR